jgi:Tol biopolymer transport system component
MALSPGTRLGPYEILESAGAGGMGEVYRAHDVRLDRDVAVKTIKGPFTERFEREARAISSLNHPNICTLHDVGEHDGSGYLVLEYIEGKPIAGPMPPEQACAIGIQICEALHAAHKKGIVHRDLKPANILITKQGVKLLDFGLAKLTTGNSGVMPSPGTTIGEQATMAALTGAHTVVGTPQYMAPEQIEGRDVDARTDIFAFGCVLYELLTGQRAFDGKTSSSIMAAVLATKPRPIDELVPLTPPGLERIVTRCLAKDPEDRWQTARDVAAELQWVGQGGSKVGLPAVVSGRRRVREGIAWAACAVAALVAAGFGVAWAKRAPEPPPVVRFPLPSPTGAQNLSPPVVSPDGRHIAFAADADGKRLIWVRSLDALEARPLAGTEGVVRPFWSPDSRFIAFMAGGTLKKVDIAGGPPATICEAPNGADGSWSAEGVILFDGRSADPLWRVPAAGGKAQALAFGEDTDKTLGAGWPEFLPDGKHFLFTLGNAGVMQLAVGSLDSKEYKPLFKTTTRVQYAEPGYLIFVRERTLVAQRFDLASQSVVGEPVPIGQGLGSGDLGLASFSVSRNGVLVYREGELTGTRLVWLDRAGKETTLLDAVADYRDTSFSPDGTRVAYDMSDNVNSTRGDVWIRDVARGVSSRFTFDATAEVNPMWSPDGRRIAFTSRAKGTGDLMVKDASGTREAEPLLMSASEEKYISDWSKDGKQILYSVRGDGHQGWDIFALPLEGDRTPRPIVKTTFNEAWATLSPDGRYMAYQSNESGRNEIYVHEFPEARNKWQISTSGGTQVHWRGDGKELFYRAGTALMAVPVTTGETFTIGSPVKLFDTRFAAVTARGHYRVWPDGQRFLVLAPLARDLERPAAVVLNWASTLRN